MTTTHFLLKEMISKGYQVIWLTHRHMLIDQTASSFYDYAPLAKHGNPKRKRLQITCVSGEHASIRSTDKSDDVMIISVQSGFRNLDYLKTVLSKKVIIVVDEAHHTVAMSYRRIINYIRKRRTNAKLLGLTATPIRGIDMESRYLHKLFDDNVIYDISMGDLIKKQILANPIFEKIETNSNFEPFISIDEVELIKKFGELPATLVDKIAHSSARNKIIVDTYMKDKERYGKTLIFALNAFHCYTLSQEFRKRGIRCDYIYSGNRNNEEKIRRFKESKNENGLDVLININILTEGSDVPDIQSIFLTRPTQSEGLLVQMVGRGLRGKFAGGTEDAIIVDFCDKWDVFNKWLNPEWLFPAETIKQPEPSGKYLKPTTIPWKVIGEIYKRMRFEGDQSIFRSLKLPIGWYPLLNDDGEDYTMLVWEDQEDNFSNIIKDKDIIINKDNVTSRYIINKYFGGFNMLPNKRDINIFMANLKDGNTLPEMFRFEDRNTIDPIQIANKIFENNIGIADILTEVEKIYEENIDIIQDVYIDFESYYSRIMENLQNRSNNISTSEIVEIPVELLPYKIEPTHNLEELKQEVIDEMFKGEYLGIESLEWTDKAYTGYYGMYYPDGDIRINKMLDSPDVDREVIKFLVYHEMLHRDYKKHDKNFRREEHKYPNYTEHNRFLDHKIYNYKMQM